MRVLLAQLNAVNRKLATRLLEEHGHTVVVSESGGAALEAVEADAFDVMLMEVQIIPATGGFDAIRTIRAKEQRSGAHLPIVALTAQTIEGVRERCLQAGADHHLTEPIQPEPLLTTLDRVRDLVSRRSSADTKIAPSSAWDIEAALNLVEGDRELLGELAQLFSDEYAKKAADFRRALEANDAPLLERLAHTLKGSSLNIAATATSQAALALEMQARAGDLVKAREQVDILERELARLLLELGTWSQKAAHDL